MTIRPNEIYRHFKGNLYKIITIANHSETEEKMVVYQALYGEFPVYVRPLDMFMSKVDREKYPDVIQEYRFEKIEQIIDGIFPGERYTVIDDTLDINSDGNSRKNDTTDLEMSLESDVKTEVEVEPEFDDEVTVDPMVMEFLEAETIAERKNILQALHHRITEDMIYTLALALDIVIDEGDLEDRYRQLMVCLNTIEKYEIER